MPQLAEDIFQSAIQLIEFYASLLDPLNAVHGKAIVRSQGSKCSMRVISPVAPSCCAGRCPPSEASARSGSPRHARSRMIASLSDGLRLGMCCPPRSRTIWRTRMTKVADPLPARARQSMLFP